MKDIYDPGYAKYITAIREKYEASQLRRFVGIWEERLNYLADLLLKHGLGFGLHVNKLGFELVFQDSLTSFMREWVNIGQNHAMNEMDKALKMTELTRGINNANSYFDVYAVKLAKVTDQSLLDQTKKILQEGIRSGETTRDTIKKLEKLYPSFTKQRLENIVRTESGKCYNWGRLTTCYKNADVLDGVRFSAIMDGRTTDICIARHGLVLPLSDQAGIASNTPPLHYQCRSIWVPVPIGMKDKKYQPNLEQYKPIMEKMPPMNGFGYQDLKGITKVVSPSQVAAVSVPVVPKKPIDDEIYGDVFTQTIPEDIKQEIKSAFEYYHAHGLTRIYEKQVEVFSVLLEKNVYAGSHHINSLLLNKHWFTNKKKLLRALADNINNLYHPPGFKSIKAVIDHEVGHNLCHRIRIHPQFGNAFKKELQDIFDDFAGQLRPISSFAEREKRAGELLSVYAMESVSELAAEGWTEFLNNPSPRPLAMRIGNFLLKYLKSTGVFQ